MDDVLLYNTALTASEIAALAGVTPGNTPPTLNPIGNKSAQVGTQLAFTATASDPDAGDTLTFSLANGSGGSVPAGASITSGGSFTWTPTAGPSGDRHLRRVRLRRHRLRLRDDHRHGQRSRVRPRSRRRRRHRRLHRTQDGERQRSSRGFPGNVFTIGDNAYETGTAAEFGCYNATWGAFKARTRPTPGNHDYGNGATPGATPYFDYFNGVGNQTGPAGDRASATTATTSAAGRARGTWSC